MSDCKHNPFLEPGDRCVYCGEVPKGNGLTLAHQELLIKLQEECAEVIHVTSKILLYGLSDVNPLEPEGPSNVERLIKEIGDAQCILSFLAEENVINWSLVVQSARNKRENIGPWLRFYQPLPKAAL